MKNWHMTKVTVSDCSQRFHAKIHEYVKECVDILQHLVELIEQTPSAQVCLKVSNMWSYSVTNLRYWMFRWNFVRKISKLQKCFLKNWHKSTMQTDFGCSGLGQKRKASSRTGKTYQAVDRPPKVDSSERFHRFHTDISHVKPKLCEFDPICNTPFKLEIPLKKNSKT